MSLWGRTFTAIVLVLAPLCAQADENPFARVFPTGSITVAGKSLPLADYVAALFPLRYDDETAPFKWVDHKLRLEFIHEYLNNDEALARAFVEAYLTVPPGTDPVVAKKEIAQRLAVLVKTGKAGAEAANSKNPPEGDRDTFWAIAPTLSSKLNAEMTKFLNAKGATWKNQPIECFICVFHANPGREAEAVAKFASAIVEDQLGVNGDDDRTCERGPGAGDDQNGDAGSSRDDEPGSPGPGRRDTLPPGRSGPVVEPPGHSANPPTGPVPEPGAGRPVHDPTAPVPEPIVDQPIVDQPIVEEPPYDLEDPIIQDDVPPAQVDLDNKDKNNKNKNNKKKKNNKPKKKGQKQQQPPPQPPPPPQFPPYQGSQIPPMEPVQFPIPDLQNTPIIPESDDGLGLLPLLFQMIQKGIEELSGVPDPSSFLETMAQISAQSAAYQDQVLSVISDIRLSIGRAVPSINPIPPPPQIASAFGGRIPASTSPAGFNSPFQLPGGRTPGLPGFDPPSRPPVTSPPPIRAFTDDRAPMPRLRGRMLRPQSTH